MERGGAGSRGRAGTPDTERSDAISSTEAARDLGECLARIKHRRDRFILMKNRLLRTESCGLPPSCSVTPGSGRPLRGLSSWLKNHAPLWHQVGGSTVTWRRTGATVHIRLHEHIGNGVLELARAAPAGGLFPPFAVGESPTRSCALTFDRPEPRDDRADLLLVGPIRRVLRRGHASPLARWNLHCCWSAAVSRQSKARETARRAANPALPAPAGRASVRSNAYIGSVISMRSPTWKIEMKRRLNACQATGLGILVRRMGQR
jgi:hypothetical protein